MGLSLGLKCFRAACAASLAASTSSSSIRTSRCYSVLVQHTLSRWQHTDAASTRPAPGAICGSTAGMMLLHSRQWATPSWASTRAWQRSRCTVSALPQQETESQHVTIEVQQKAQQKEREENADVPAGRALRLLPVPQMLLGGTAGFAAIAYDVFSPNSLHLLSSVDRGAHYFVAETFSREFRAFWGDIVVSDVFIALAVTGWVACTLAALIPSDRRFTAPQQVATKTAVIALAWAGFVWGAGPVQYDPFLVDVLKNIFCRERPSDILTTFSFPSGHTSSAAFLVGSLLFVLLPAVLPPPPPGGQQAGPAQTRVSPWLYKIQGSWSLWGLSVATTAAGRVLADAHWVSDTLAATCLGVACTAALAGVVRPFMASATNVTGKQQQQD